MIREATLNDIERINNLGIFLNSDFKKLFNIEKIIEDNYSYIYVYTDDENICAFIHVEKHFEVLDLINIVVDIHNRNHGIASKLLDYIINNFEFERMILEVDETNIPALNLYYKFNFKKINVRKKYYGVNDAIIMEMKKI